MAHQDAASAADGAIPVSPTLTDLIQQADASAADGLRAPAEYEPVDQRTIVITGLAALIAAGAGIAAQILVHLIGFVTNLAFYGRLSGAFVSPGGGHRAPAALLLIPILGGIIVGFMASYGSAAIRGHGIPEAMEQVLFDESRIPARDAPSSSRSRRRSRSAPAGRSAPRDRSSRPAARSVRSLGQLLRVTADERKTLLAAGAAAGMAATFGSPVSAVLLAVELLLFEYRPRSLIPVALAAAVATRCSHRVRRHSAGVRDAADARSRVAPRWRATRCSACSSASSRVGDHAIRRTGIEDAVRALGQTLPCPLDVVAGVRRDRGRRHRPDRAAHARRRLRQHRRRDRRDDRRPRAHRARACSSCSRGRSTSGAAPPAERWRRCSRSAAGSVRWLGAIVAAHAPGLGVDAHVARLVGMAAMFAGASHALLASVVFAFETTRQPLGLLPLLGGCTAAFLVSLLLNRALDHDGEARSPRSVRAFGVLARLSEPRARRRRRHARRRDPLRRLHGVRGDHMVRHRRGRVASGIPGRRRRRATRRRPDTARHPQGAR